MPLTREDLEAAGLDPREVQAYLSDDDGDDGDDAPADDAPPPRPRATKPATHAPADEIPSALMDPQENWDDDGDDDGDDAPDPGEPAETPPEQEPEQEPEPAPTAAEAPPALSFTNEDYEATQKSVADIRTEDDALQQRYNDGEIDDDELAAQRADIRTRYDQAFRQQAVMDAELTRHEEAATAAWNSALQRFAALGEATNRVISDEAEITRFERELGAVHEHNPGASYDQMLAIAYRRLTAMDEARYPPLSAPGKAAAPAKPAEKPRRRDVPTTLGDAPAAAGEGVENSRFQRLDNLDPAKLERELARMSQEEIDEYMASTG